jgi:hypothetical protein
MACTVYDFIRNSPAWDARYNLPLCPALNNPWLYMAYAQRNMKRAARDAIWLSMIEIEAHFLKCESKPGFFSRWPDGSGGAVSWDEIVGAASMSRFIARRILAYLDSTDGEWGSGTDLADDMYRFPFLRPFLLAASGYELSPISKAEWSAFILWDAFKRSPTDQGGALKNSLMIDSVGGLAGAFWKKRTQTIMTPAQALAIEPKEYPVFAATAPETW